MRFTILTQYYPPEVGAAQVRLAAFATELRRRGHAVHVVTALPNYPTGVILPAYRGRLWVREKQAEIPVLRTWIYPATGRSVARRLANYLSFTLSSLAGLARTPRADILFVESPPLFLAGSGWLMAALRGERLCLNISDLWPDSVVALGLMREGAFVHAARCFEAWVYRQAWRVCGATQGVVDGIVSKGAAPEKVRLLPNGVDTLQFQARPYQPVEGAPRTFVYAGTHGYAHGVEVILRAAELLRAEPAIRFLLVGGGADKPRLQALSAELQLPNVRFLDPIPQAEVPALLTQAYAALVTVAAGDFFAGTRSAKLFPAMAAGRAIVHSGAGEGAELVRLSNSGIVTPPADAQALAAAIYHLLHEPATAAALGANGRAFVEREYSWSAIVDRFLQDLERVHAPLG